MADGPCCNRHGWGVATLSLACRRSLSFLRVFSFGLSFFSEAVNLLYFIPIPLLDFIFFFPIVPSVNSVSNLNRCELDWKGPSENDGQNDRFLLSTRSLNRVRFFLRLYFFFLLSVSFLQLHPDNAYLVESPLLAARALVRQQLTTAIVERRKRWIVLRSTLKQSGQYLSFFFEKKIHTLLLVLCVDIVKEKIAF